ncbi:MAG: dipicolinate synthase subunit DpsA [Clostridia bacterium]|nr:dipicolinate synthase subunit DpsA [Clostridia bacterium]
MSKNFAVIGGDLRIVNLARLIAKDEKQVYVYGLEKVEEIKNISNLIITKTLEEAISKANFVIGPMPFSKDDINVNAPFSNKEISISDFFKKINNKIFIAGNFSSNVKEVIKENNIKYIDLMDQEELVILNALSTAEGAIQVAMENTNILLHGSKILILGFGRISKILANKLKALSVDVTCAARKKEDFAWMESYGYNSTDINKLNENLNQYDIIFNTVPHLILTEERLKYVKKDCVLIDLASKPGGIDKNAKYIWALALPGKVAPVTSAEFMKKTIYKMIEEG